MVLSSWFVDDASSTVSIFRSSLLKAMINHSVLIRFRDQNSCFNIERYNFSVWEVDHGYELTVTISGPGKKAGPRSRSLSATPPQAWPGTVCLPTASRSLWVGQIPWAATAAKKLRWRWEDPVPERSVTCFAVDRPRWKWAFDCKKKEKQNTWRYLGFQGISSFFKMRYFFGIDEILG